MTAPARRFAALLDAMRTRLWPLPAAGILLGLVLGVALPELDGHLDASLPEGVSRYLFGGGPSAARTLLGAVAGSLITVTSLTFSLTVVTLQLAGGQFSPRLLRTFTRDRVVHATLALFLGTFTYALAVLRTVRSASDDGAVFVPQIAVSVAFVSCVLSVLGLVLFLAHLASEIRVETMLRTVRASASITLDRVAPAGEGLGEVVLPTPPPDALVLEAPRSGFVLGIDEPRVLRAATDAGATVLLERAPGASVVAGTPLGVAWPVDGPWAEGVAEHLADAVCAGVAVGVERTEQADVGFGLQQLADIAARALSPGTNDPTTAVHAVGHASALLCAMAGRRLGPRVHRDDGGRVRLALDGPDLAALLEVVAGPVRRYGAADPLVLLRLTALLRELAWCAQAPSTREAVRAQLERLSLTVEDQAFDAPDREALRAEAQAVERALRGRWRLGTPSA